MAVRLLYAEHGYLSLEDLLSLSRALSEDGPVGESRALGLLHRVVSTLNREHEHEGDAVESAQVCLQILAALALTGRRDAEVASQVWACVEALDGTFEKLFRRETPHVGGRGLRRPILLILYRLTDYRLTGRDILSLFDQARGCDGVGGAANVSTAAAALAELVIAPPSCEIEVLAASLSTLHGLTLATSFFSEREQAGGGDDGGGRLAADDAAQGCGAAVLVPKVHGKKKRGKQKGWVGRNANNREQASVMHELTNQYGAGVNLVIEVVLGKSTFRAGHPGAAARKGCVADDPQEEYRFFSRLGATLRTLTSRALGADEEADVSRAALALAAEDRGAKDDTAPCARALGELRLLCLPALRLVYGLLLHGTQYSLQMRQCLVRSGFVARAVVPFLGIAVDSLAALKQTRQLASASGHERDTRLWTEGLRLALRALAVATFKVNTLRRLMREHNPTLVIVAALPLVIVSSDEAEVGQDRGAVKTTGPTPRCPDRTTADVLALLIK